ncbi:MAG: hypothetical protein JWP74_396 [Marmoricola sp.]|nr:hypothetical protein [Marmoricola sp.]
MTPLSPASRAAEAFARAVDDRATVVDGARGDVADRYGDLLTCVDVLRAQEIPAPRADFVAGLRMRLMDAADTLLVPAETKLAPVVPLHAPANRRQRRISIAAAAVIVIGGTAGVAAAAESSLPGSALYPIKRGIESAQVSLNGSDSGKGQDLLRQASTRLDEVSGLLASGRSASQINQTLDAFSHSATSGADLLFDSYQRDGDSQDISRLRAMLGSQLATLDRLADQAPASSRPSFDNAKALLHSLDQQASVMCTSCTASGVASSPLQLSSATALESLLVGPASAARQAQRLETSNSHLAQKADQIAKNTKQHLAGGAGAPGTTTGGTTTTGGGLPVPVPGGSKSITGLSSGLGTLLGQVDKATGGVTAPLTTTLDTTLGMLGLGGSTTP